MREGSKLQKGALAGIIAAGIGWGTAGVFVHWLKPYGFQPLQMTAVRGLVSFLCMLLYVLFRDKHLLKVKLWELLMFTGSGFALFGTAAFYYLSMKASSIATGVVLMYTAPVYIMLFSVAFFGEKLSALKLFSIGCMLVGCCLVAGIIGGMTVNAEGIVFGVLSGISYAAYNIFTKWEMRHGCNPVSATSYNFLVVAIIGLCLSDPLLLITNIGTQPVVTVPLLVAMGFVTCFMPYVLYTIALKILPVGTASALAIVEPMSATIFGLMIGESMTVFSAVGIVLILLAVLLLSRAEKTIQDNDIPLTVKQKENGIVI